MKTKRRRHRSSSEESEISDGSEKTSSSESESDQSSASEKHYRKKKKRTESSDSESESDDHRRSKKRKHKKKKKKHMKRKRRSDSVADSESDRDGGSSISDGEVSPSPKKKHKHKQKRGRNSSVSVIDDDHKERKLHSVVKECRVSSEERHCPQRTYYQKECPRRSISPVDVYEREREVQRFYRGSSKERRFEEERMREYERECEERLLPVQQETFNKTMLMSQVSCNVRKKQRPQRGFRRRFRFEGNRQQGQYNKRPKEDAFPPREDPRGFNRNQHEDRRQPPRRQDFDNGRDYRDRRQQDPERFRQPEREFPDRRDRYREEPQHSDRSRDVRREKPPARPDRPPQQHHSGLRPSGSPERYRERERDRERERERERERDRERERGRWPERDERAPRADTRRRHDEPRRDEHQRPREKKSRFADAEDGKEYSWGKTEVKKEGKDPSEKEKPNFGLSGKLTADANTVNGVVIKYTEPDDAKQPKRRWRFYPFKGDKALPILYIHRQSAFLIGRDKKVADIALEHPSISKQHAALQYRATPFTRPDGSQGRRVRPYIIDLESANGTFVNNKKIEPRRYVELLERDVVKFGFSQREYVLLHENSKDDAQDDDNQDPPAAPLTTAEQIKQEKRIKQELAADGE